MVLNAEIYGVNLRIQSEYRKIRTRNNSVFGHFSRSKGSWKTFKNNVKDEIKQKTVFNESFSLLVTLKINHVNKINTKRESLPVKIPMRIIIWMM